MSERPYAFPAYDCYDGGTAEPDRLTDGDLLAPGLLNVPVKIRSFYGLQRVRGRLEEALRQPILERAIGRCGGSRGASTGGACAVRRTG